jgi:hypothetical protein
VDVSKIRTTLLLGLFLLAIGSLVIHTMIHSPFTSPESHLFPSSIAFLFGLIDALVVTFLFSRKKTAAWGYLLNGLLVIYGTVFMTHFGWGTIGGSESSFLRYIFHATTPEILIAWADFFVGAALYRLWFIPPPVKDQPAAG